MLLQSFKAMVLDPPAQTKDDFEAKYLQVVRSFKGAQHPNIERYEQLNHRMTANQLTDTELQPIYDACCDSDAFLEQVLGDDLKALTSPKDRLLDSSKGTAS